MEIIGKLERHSDRPERLSIVRLDGTISSMLAQDHTRDDAAALLAEKGFVLHADDTISARAIEPNPAAEAAAICDKWVARFGISFHPDTRGADYIGDNGARYLSAESTAEYDADMARLFSISADPYDESIAAWQRAGM